MSYLKHKPGSIEEMMANQAKKLNDSAYQDMFKKELDKAGKGIGSMSPKEKKDFFNKIDDKYKAKNEDTKEEVSQKDVDKFHTKLDKLVHKSFGHSSDEKKKEVKEEDAYDKDDEKPKSKPKKEAVDNPYAVGMAAAMKKTGDKPPLKKSTITKAHDIAKSIKKDEKNEELINEIGSFSKIYTKKSTRSHPSKQAEIVMYKGLVKSVNVGLRGKPPKRDTDIGIIGRDGTKYYAQGEGQAGLKALGKFSNREAALKAIFDYSVKSKQIVEEEAKYPHKMYSKDGKEVEAKTPEDHKKYADMGYTHKNETHTFMTKDMNKSKKDAKGEKEIVDPAPKMKFKEAYKKAKKEAMNTVGDATADQVNQRVGEGPKENDPDIKKPKAKADTGSKATPVDTSPEVEYKN